MNYFIVSGKQIIGTSRLQHVVGAETIAVPSWVKFDYPNWYFIIGGEIVLNEDVAIPEARQQRIQKIKQEAGERIAALDWKLDRAREREDASWESLEAVNAVLAMRESIRRSSDTAEAAVMELRDIAAIEAYTWDVTINVPAPRRVTRQQFLDRLTAVETAGIIEAAQSSSAIAAWILRLENADFVNLDDPACLMAMESLEIAGLIAAGRAQEIIQ